MRATEPLPLHHSWPLSERDGRFDLGLIDANDAFARVCTPMSAADRDVIRLEGAGEWACNLSDNELTWSQQVFAIFGLPDHAPASREDSVRLYEEGSRAAMERLRSHAIRHRRGFVLDARIHAADGQDRWMRLIAAPVCMGARVVGLHGLKFDVSATYR